MPVKPSSKSKSNSRKQRLQKAQADVWGLINNRIEDAVSAGLIDMIDDRERCTEIAITLGEFALLLSIIMPELYPAEDKPMPSARTMTLPATKERTLVYRQRTTAGERLYHPNDVDPVTHDRAALAARKRTSDE